MASINLVSGDFLRQASHDSPREPRGDLEIDRRGKGTESANMFPDDLVTETDLGVESVLHAAGRTERQPLRDCKAWENVLTWHR